jgi:transketolase
MYARIGRANSPLLYKKEDLRDIELGKGLIAKDGSDVSIIACGTMVDQAVDAQEQLAKDGVSARIIDMYTIKPLDEKLVLKCARETNAVVSVEEHSVIGGLGGAISEVLAEHGSAVPFKRIGVQDMFCESGEPDELFEKYGLSTPHIVKTVKKLLKE